MLLKNTSIYLIGNLVNALLPFVLLPMLTRYIDPEGYGQLAMFQVVIGFLSGIVGVNSVAAATRKYYEKSLTEKDTAKYNGSCITIAILTGIPFLVFSVLFKTELEFFLSLKLNLIALGILVSILTIVLQLRLEQWEVRGESKSYIFFQMAQCIVNLSLSLILVYFIKFGVAGRISAQVLTVVIFSVVSLISLKKQKIAEFVVFDLNSFKEIFIFGVPLIPHVTGYFLLSSFDRFIINSKVGLSATGYYMLAAQLASGLLMLFDALNKAFVPWLYSHLESKNKFDQIKVVKFTYLIFGLILLIMISGFAIAPAFLKILVGIKYLPAAEIIGWLVLGQCFSGMYLMVSNYVFFSRRTGLLSIISILIGVLNIVLMIYLLNIMGVVGAAMSFSISMMLRFLLVWILANRLHPMPWNFLKWNLLNVAYDNFHE